jgi:hypothetical protein
MQLIHLASAVQPKSFDASKNTFEVMFYSGDPVVRFDWWAGEEYDLKFEVSDKAVDLSRLKTGAPFLKNHFATIEDTIGVVEDAWLSGGKSYARVRLSEREDVQPLAQDIASGIIRNVSMGAATLEEVITRDKTSNRKLVTATKWMPMEISAVAIPADAKAQILSNEIPNHLAGAARKHMAELFEAYKPQMLTQAIAALRLEAMNLKGAR